MLIEGGSLMVRHFHDIAIDGNKYATEFMCKKYRPKDEHQEKTVFNQTTDAPDKHNQPSIV